MNKRGFVICLMVLLVFFLMTGVAFASVKTQAKLIELEGEVQIIRAGGEKPFKAFLNMKLAEGDRILTGVKSFAKIQLDEQSIITLDENTKIYLSELRDTEGDKQNSISLQAGGIGSTIKERLAGSSRFEIKTPTAVMGVRGTDFYTQYYDGLMDLRVVDGVVEVKVIDMVGEGVNVFLVPALKQIMLEAGKPVTEPAEEIKALELIGLPVFYLNRINEIKAENSELIPDELMETMEEAIKEATEGSNRRLVDKNLAQDELSAMLEEEIRGNIQAATPATAPGGPKPVTPTPIIDDWYYTGPPVITEPEEPIEEPKDEISFEIRYYDSGDWILVTDNKIEKVITGEVYNYLDLQLISEIPGVNYEAETSDEAIIKKIEELIIQGMDSSSFDSVNFEILKAGKAEIAIIATADGYQKTIQTILLTIIKKDEEEEPELPEAEFAIYYENENREIVEDGEVGFFITPDSNNNYLTFRINSKIKDSSAGITYTVYSTDEEVAKIERYYKEDQEFIKLDNLRHGITYITIISNGDNYISSMKKFKLEVGSMVAFENLEADIGNIKPSEVKYEDGFFTIPGKVDSFSFEENGQEIKYILSEEREFIPSISVIVH